MNIWKLLSCIAAFGMATAANAEIITPNLKPLWLFGNVTNAFPGIALHRLTNASGNTYSPIVSNATKSSCTTYAACGYLSPMFSIGGNLIDTSAYRTCYNAGQAGQTSFSCSQGFAVIEGTLVNPTDFVEVEFTWSIDPPEIIGYDALGNEIAHCQAYTAGCSTSYQLSPSGEYIGTVRLSMTNALIKRFVTASNVGSSRLIGLQYNKL